MEEYQKIVYWSANGLEFIIKDVVKFEEIVLPRYFRHKKMNSFVRQLNMYGFHKMKHNHFKSTFKHEFFQKDRQYSSPYLETCSPSSKGSPNSMTRRMTMRPRKLSPPPSSAKDRTTPKSSRKSPLWLMRNGPTSRRSFCRPPK